MTAVKHAFLYLTLSVSWFSAVGAIACAAEGEPDGEFFEKRIRAILVERCEGCHSTSKGKTSGGLALDTRDGWTQGGDSGTPIKPGHPDESLFIRAVRYDADGPQMPPKDKGGKLPDGEVALLTEWVRRGAFDPRVAATRVGGMTADEVRTWWAFQPLQRPIPPAIDHSTWPKSDIDRFILAKLQKHALSPAATADRRTLLRRATFDLTGLPPTVTEMNAFLDDPAETAFDRVVDRLLNSKAYGERWARHWLDVVRYADFHDANPKARTASCEITEAWKYRDWVVDSLNADLPYDQFIQHQIAGDLLPSPTGDEVYPEGLIATTFLSNGVWDRGDADKEKIVSDMADDNIDTVGKAFLGLTLGCARCHDHKFDPVSTEDYYALAGIFYSSHILKELGIKGGEYTMNRVPLVPRAILDRRQSQETELTRIQADLEILNQLHRYEKLTAGGQALIPNEFASTQQSLAAIGADGSIFVTGAGPKDSYTIKAIAPEGLSMRYLRLEVLTDPSLPSTGPGNAGNGNFVINRIGLNIEETGSGMPSRPVKLVSATADFEQKGFAVIGAIDDKPESGWSIESQTGKNHVAVFEIPADVKIAFGSMLTITIDQTHSEMKTLGKFRLSVLDAITNDPPSKSAELARLSAERDRLKQELAIPIPVAMAVQEGGMPGGLFPNIQDVPIHIRGSYARLGPVVPRRMPRFLAGDNQPPIANGSGRRELANWIVSKDNPLTARVIVNRIWQWHFGDGLVRTPSNFGKMGESPSHPELLDWLATSFVQDGWSIKTLHRRIMLSATYQQASRVPTEQFERDPENRWLGRFAARRLEAEAIRDAMLCVSNELNFTAGGPADDDFTSRRRSLYVQTARWDRSGYAMLFDAANPDSSTERRTVSIVAPQALLFLNHHFIQSQAEALTRRLLAEGHIDDDARIQLGYQLLFGRPAHEAELSIAKSIVTSGDQGHEKGWLDLVHVLLCCNEFVYVD